MALFMPPKCAPKPQLTSRPLMTDGAAQEVAGLFKILASDTRVSLLHALVGKGELCVSDLASFVGMKPQAVSNQLQRLVDRGILGQRRDGTRIYYRLVDRCVATLLERGLCLVEDSATRVERARR